MQLYKINISNEYKSEYMFQKGNVRWNLGYFGNVELLIVAEILHTDNLLMVVSIC
jgi:hypothetical protein